MMGVLDMGQQLGSLTDEMESSSQEISCRSHLGRIGVGQRHGPSSQKHRDLHRIELVVLGLGSVDETHVEGMAQNEVDLLASAQIGQPVPGEDTLGGDDKILPEGLDRSQEGFRAALDVLLEQRFSAAAEDAEIHGSGVKVDATVVRMNLVVESHGPLLTVVGCAPTTLLRVE